MEPNSFSPEHVHEFDARVLILEGEMTIISNGAEQTYRAGDTFAMNAGRWHAQQGGPQGCSSSSDAAIRSRQAASRVAPVVRVSGRLFAARLLLSTLGPPRTGVDLERRARRYATVAAANIGSKPTRPWGEV
jgi:cupin domain